MLDFKPSLSAPNISTSKPPVAMLKIMGGRFFDTFLWIGCLSFLHFGLQAILTTLWLRILIINTAGLGFFFILFVIIPTFFSGQTIGRRLFKLQICRARTFQNLNWRFFLLREIYIMLTPILIITILLLISMFLLPQILKPAVLWRTSSLTLLWFVFLFLFQKINPNQQIFIDRWYDAWIIERLPTIPNSKQNKPHELVKNK